MVPKKWWVKYKVSDVLIRRYVPAHQDTLPTPVPHKDRQVERMMSKISLYLYNKYFLENIFLSSLSPAYNNAAAP